MPLPVHAGGKNYHKKKDKILVDALSAPLGAQLDKTCDMTILR